MRTGDVVDPWVNVRPEIVTAIGQLAPGGGSMESRANAARAVGILRGKPALPELIAAMQTKDTQVIYEVLIAFQKIADPSAGDKARTFIRDMEPRIQLAAIETVGLLHTREAMPDLRRVFDDKKASVAARRAALVALADAPRPRKSRRTSNAASRTRTTASAPLPPKASHVLRKRPTSPSFNPRSMKSRRCRPGSALRLRW